jgi:hypothetical protein
MTSGRMLQPPTEEKVCVNPVIDHASVIYYQHFSGSRKLVEAVGSVVPQIPSMSSQASSMQNRDYRVQNAWTRGQSYTSEPQLSQLSWPSWPSQPSRPLQVSGPSRPRAVARNHGYTQNHAHYQDHLDAWALKASSNGNLRDAVAVKVSLKYLRPGQKTLSVISVSVQ